MAATDNNKNNLSIEDKLRATEKYISKMKGILAKMDEIAAIKRANGDKNADSDEIGGYKRSSVIKLISELEKQRDMFVESLDEEKQKAYKAKYDAIKAKENEIKAKDDALKAKSEALAVRERELQVAASKKNNSVVASFINGDNALAIESLYTGLSMDIEKMRDDILQEMKYTYKQDMAIYDDLSAKIDAIKAVDANALEEGLKPLKTIEEKVNALEVVDYDAIAAKMTDKLSGAKIDYDVLAEKVAQIMTGYAESVISPKIQLDSIERRLSEMQHTLSGIMSVKQMPDYRKLDALIEEYLRTLSYDNIPDILILANEIREKANRHIAGGNALRGESMLAELGARLKNVAMSGYGALVVVEDAVKTHSLPKVLSENAFLEFKESCGELERSPAVCGDEIISRVVRAKKALFNDAELYRFDNETMSELLDALSDIQEDETPRESAVTNIIALKKEIMSFNLSYFVDLVPVTADPEKTENVDTQAILNAIANIKMPEVITAAPPVQENRQTATAQETASAAFVAESGGDSAIAETKKVVPEVRVKKQKVMRPGVSSKDNKPEKVNQPLRIVRRSINTNDTNPDSLSKVLVGEVAQKIANSMIK